MNSDQTIDYESLAQDAMRGLIRTVLKRVQKHGLPGDHHFYIAFYTQAPGVTVSDRLKAKYPEEMTIVMQHRFWGLEVSDDKFEIKLSFDAIPERLVVPFSAIKVFFDPSVPYGLQFEDIDDASEEASSLQGAHRRQKGRAKWAGDLSLIDGDNKAQGGSTEPGDKPARKITPKKRTRKKPSAKTGKSMTATPQARKKAGSFSDNDRGSPGAPEPGSEIEEANAERETSKRTRNGKPPRPTTKPAAKVTSATSQKNTASDKSDVDEDGGRDIDNGAKVISLDAFRKK